jgi:hypothetical protein
MSERRELMLSTYSEQDATSSLIGQENRQKQGVSEEVVTGGRKVVYKTVERLMRNA